jgi:hypothetical protein
MCNLETLETHIHKFYDCPRVKQMWLWVATIIFRLKHTLQVDGKMKMLDIHCSALLLK